MDLSITNTWLAIGAISLLFIALAMVAGCIVLARTAKAVSESAARTSVAIEQVALQMAPLATQTAAFLNDAQNIMGRLRRTDDMAHAAVENIADGWRTVSTVARPLFGPAFSIARIGATLMQWMARRSRSERDKQDQAAEARFTDEGGSNDETPTSLDRTRTGRSSREPLRAARSDSEARA
jgi:uncharacterized protein YoxC